MSKNGISRRDFLKAASISAAGLAAGCNRKFAGSEKHAGTRPNFLVIVVDQLSLDAISANGNTDANTPNIDRLMKRGMSFDLSHSTDPVCSPARASIFTGRMPSETGVYFNNRPIHDSVPDMGQWLRKSGYDTFYCGKWHLPVGYPVELKGFDVIEVGSAQGDMVDSIVSRHTEAWLGNRKSEKPFLYVAGLLQPHDICYWAIKGSELVPEKNCFEQIVDEMPDLPPNNRVRPKAPEKLDKLSGYRGFSDDQWRYYLYVYNRQVEMLDADVGRILDGLDRSGHTEDTVVIFTSDHGEGGGRHLNVQKWYPYEESVRVPMIVSWPGRIKEDCVDTEHLVSGLDVMSTVCDYAGVSEPDDCKGLSLRPLLEDRKTDWRDYVVVENQVIGRTVRSHRYKYVKYKDDPVEMLFDMEKDPWEMTNLYDNPEYSDIIEKHRKMLAEWEGSLKVIDPTRPTHPDGAAFEELFRIAGLPVLRPES